MPPSGESQIVDRLMTIHKVQQLQLQRTASSNANPKNVNGFDHFVVKSNVKEIHAANNLGELHDLVVN